MCNGCESRLVPKQNAHISFESNFFGTAEKNDVHSSYSGLVHLSGEHAPLYMSHRDRYFETALTKEQLCYNVIISLVRALQLEKRHHIFFAFYKV